MLSKNNNQAIRYYDKVALRCREYSASRTKEYIQQMLFPGKRGIFHCYSQTQNGKDSRRSEVRSTFPTTLPPINIKNRLLGSVHRGEQS